MVLTWLKTPLETPLACVPVLLTIESWLLGEADLILGLFLNLLTVQLDLLFLRPNCYHSIELLFFLSITNCKRYKTWSMDLFLDNTLDFQIH